MKNKEKRALIFMFLLLSVVFVFGGYLIGINYNETCPPSQQVIEITNLEEERVECESLGGSYYVSYGVFDDEIYHECSKTINPLDEDMNDVCEKYIYYLGETRCAKTINPLEIK